MDKPKLIEYLGRQFAYEGSKSYSYYGIYECPYCGKHFRCTKYDVANGQTKSCGCHNIQAIIDRNYRHGLSHTRIHTSWLNMIQRCTNPKCTHFDNYGGRNISVCMEWRKSFAKFYDWAMANGYSDTLFINRSNNDGNYTPQNCKWSDRPENAQNTRIRKDNKTGYRGVRKVGDKYQARIRAFGIKLHLGTFSTPEKAALAYNEMVIKNGWHHTLNII